MKSLQLLDFKDRDLLWAHEETCDEDGWATSRDVARTIGIDHRHPAQCVGSRYGGLKKLGILESKATKGDLLWRITDLGQDFLHARELTKALQEMLAALDEGRTMILTETLGRQVARESKTGLALSSRAWRHELGRVNGRRRI